jgi:hypothetical protein
VRYPPTTKSLNSSLLKATDSTRIGILSVSSQTKRYGGGIKEFFPLVPKQNGYFIRSR